MPAVYYVGLDDNEPLRRPILQLPRAEQIATAKLQVPGYKVAVIYINDGRGFVRPVKTISARSARRSRACP